MPFLLYDILPNIRLCYGDEEKISGYQRFYEGEGMITKEWHKGVFYSDEFVVCPDYGGNSCGGG